MSHVRRVEMIAAHLAGQEGVAPQPTAAAGPKSPNDVVIIAALRTPIARGKKGSFRDTCPEELLAAVLKGILDRTKIDPALVEDIQVGNVLPAGGGATTARMAQLYAGFPNTSSIATVNRQCSSGLQAVANIAAAIQSGTIDIGIGAGVESMTKGYGAGAMASEFSSRVQSNKEADDCLLPMGITSENVATKYGVTRAKQDAFSVVSHQRAAEAQAKGLFDEEIIPVSIANPDDPDKELVVTKDEGVRGDTTLQSLAKLKPAFKEDGSTTAGNASQVSDGAAAVLLMRRSVAEKLGYKPIGRFVSFAVAGVPPNIMGIGPAVAIPKVLQKAGLKKEDIAVFEINEAFASQAVYCVETLGLDPAKVNPKGGAIALGHPLGCTGARQIATLLPELKRRNAKYGVTSMCIGSGMGAASVIERE